MLAARLAWVSIAARGVDAVPDVKRSTATSSGARSTRGTAVGGRASRSTGSTAWPPAVTREVAGPAVRGTGAATAGGPRARAVGGAAGVGGPPLAPAGGAAGEPGTNSPTLWAT